MEVLMKLELINVNKIKIILEPEDLTKFDLSFDGLNYNELSTRQVFWEVMNVAKQRTGFDIDGSKLLVEAFPEPAGGFALYVTKVEDESCPEGVENEVKKLLRIKSLKKPEPVKFRTPRSDRYIFVFEDFEAVLKAITRFKEFTEPRIIDSSLYLYRGMYYFIFTAASFDDYEAKQTGNMLAALSDYGIPQNKPELYEYHIMEHGKCLIEEDVLSTISAHFSK
jgi:negative regulator of genetic competence, sporulation and motility